MDTVAFKLRDELAGTVTQYETDDDPGTEVPAFTGGVVRSDSDGGSINLVDELAAGNGTIVVNAAELPELVVALDEHPALERVDAGAAAPTVTPPADPAEAREAAIAELTRQNRDELVELAAAAELDTEGTKAELAARIVDNAGEAGSDA